MTINIMAGEYKDESFELPFNPNEYTETLTNIYKEDELVGLKNAIDQFKSIKEGDLTLNLLFDTTSEGIDVRVQLFNLDDISRMDKKLHAPPPCQFVWGSLTFYGVVSEYSRKFTYFYSDGTPARANVTLKLKRYKSTEEIEKENELHSSDVTKVHQLKEGESLFYLAHNHYQDPTLWRKLARDNGIDDPLNIELGSMVRLAPKDK
ncbi:LysM peptidoglycan-binding domain-containing protein [Sulfurovum sp. bin170]|uniref:CIS tube protein n=1 Tax=Sulfurovum sp. bin170 TaxID=2695268 RepID=UPI002102CDBA|nr:LysM peptidoglycan-binding domain-containing protein [Sulfurovum sp. bin170]